MMTDGMCIEYDSDSESNNYDSDAVYPLSISGYSHITSTSDSINILLAWCASHGIYIDPRLRIHTHPGGGGIGVFCAGTMVEDEGKNIDEDGMRKSLDRFGSSVLDDSGSNSVSDTNEWLIITKGTSLVRIPKSAILSIRTSSFSSLFASGDQVHHNIENNVGNATELPAYTELRVFLMGSTFVGPPPYHGVRAQLALALVLYGELLRGTESPWYGYLQSLPCSVPVALFWGQFECDPDTDISSCFPTRRRPVAPQTELSFLSTSLQDFVRGSDSDTRFTEKKKDAENSSTKEDGAVARTSEESEPITAAKRGDAREAMAWIRGTQVELELRKRVEDDDVSSDEIDKYVGWGDSSSSRGHSRYSESEGGGDEDSQREETTEVFESGRGKDGHSAGDRKNEMYPRIRVQIRRFYFATVKPTLEAFSHPKSSLKQSRVRSQSRPVSKSSAKSESNRNAGEDEQEWDRKLDNETVAPAVIHTSETAAAYMMPPTLQGFEDAYALVSSRAFIVDAYHGLAMVPIADAFDHAHDNHVHLETDYDVCATCGSFAECPHDDAEECLEGEKRNPEHNRPHAYRDANPLRRTENKQEPASSDIVEAVPKEVIDGYEDTCDMVCSRHVVLPPPRQVTFESSGSSPQEQTSELELFNTYGSGLTNAQLLVRYGFALLDEGNENDRIVWGWDELFTLILSMEGHNTAEVGLLIEEELTGKKTAPIGDRSDVPGVAGGRETHARLAVVELRKIQYLFAQVVSARSATTSQRSQDFQPRFLTRENTTVDMNNRVDSSAKPQSITQEGLPSSDSWTTRGIDTTELNLVYEPSEIELERGINGCDVLPASESLHSFGAERSSAVANVLHKRLDQKKGASTVRVSFGVNEEGQVSSHLWIWLALVAGFVCGHRMDEGEDDAVKPSERLKMADDAVSEDENTVTRVEEALAWLDCVARVQKVLESQEEGSGPDNDIQTRTADAHGKDEDIVVDAEIRSQFNAGVGVTEDDGRMSSLDMFDTNQQIANQLVNHGRKRSRSRSRVRRGRRRPTFGVSAHPSDRMFATGVLVDETGITEHGSSSRTSRSASCRSPVVPGHSQRSTRQLVNDDPAAWWLQRVTRRAGRRWRDAASEASRDNLTNDILPVIEYMSRALVRLCDRRVEHMRYGGISVEEMGDEIDRLPRYMTRTRMAAAYALSERRMLESCIVGWRDLVRHS